MLKIVNSLLNELSDKILKYIPDRLWDRNVSHVPLNALHEFIFKGALYESYSLFKKRMKYNDNWYQVFT